MPLSSIEEYAPKVSTSIFTLLHKYSGSASGDTFEMIQTAFKVGKNCSYLKASYESNAYIMLISGRNCCGGTCNETSIDTEQIRVLLTYAEQVLNDATQQSIAFGVLKAVIKRKLMLEELPTDECGARIGDNSANTSLV